MPKIASSLKEIIRWALPDAISAKLMGRHYYRALRDFREGEEADMSVVRYLVAPGETAIDIGANIGIYTRLLSGLAGPDGRVVSFEAVPSTHSILARNVERLALGNVRVLNYAISEADGNAEMEIPAFRGFYRAQLAAGGDAGSGGPGPKGRRVPVETRTLDSLFGGYALPIAFVKCDIEGHELSCIRGAGNLLDRHAPAWLIEIGGDPDATDSNGGRLFEEFRRRGYGAFWFDGKELRARAPGDASINYFLLKKEHIRRLEERGFPFPVRGKEKNLPDRNYQAPISETAR